MAKNFEIADIKAESRYTVATVDKWDGTAKAEEMTGAQLVAFANAAAHLYDIHAEEIAEPAQIGSTLYLQKMGCNFRPGEHERSDIENYRVRTLDECIPGKDGRMYFLEFGLWHNRTGKPLKKPIPEIINPAALHLDTEYTDESGMNWRNCKLEADIHAQNYSYTKADILTVVNEISTAEYSTVKFVDYFEFVQEAGKNFTPSAAICKWAKAHKLPTKNTLDGIRVKLYTGEYKYMAYHVHSQADGNEKVTVILEEV